MDTSSTIRSTFEKHDEHIPKRLGRYEERPPAVRSRRVIGARIAEGLHHAHELRDSKGKPLNIVHRDVNASNVFITYDGQVKIIDFGLAKAANRVSRTAAGIVEGKLAYIFALGTTLWELTVDRRLFKEKATSRPHHRAQRENPKRDEAR